MIELLLFLILIAVCTLGGRLGSIANEIELVRGRLLALEQTGEAIADEIGRLDAANE